MWICLPFLEELNGLLAFPAQPFGNLQTKPFNTGGKNVMAQTVICPICKKELEGCDQVIRKSPGRIAVALFRETSDCNWTQCKSCKTILCKVCVPSVLLAFAAKEHRVEITRTPYRKKAYRSKPLRCPLRRLPEPFGLFPMSWRAPQGPSYPSLPRI